MWKTIIIWGLANKLSQKKIFLIIYFRKWYDSICDSVYIKNKVTIMNENTLGMI